MYENKLRMQSADINMLLKGFDCKCGRRHTCDIGYVYIEKGAITKLSDICKKYNNVLIVADGNTFKAAGELTEAALAGKTLKKIVFDGSEILVPNEIAIETVNQNLSHTDVIIGIGSGVIQDLCKYVSHQSGIPYVIVATAPSMDGYASTGAAMILGGMKVTYPAGLPLAIVADTTVLARAPMDMLKAGFGDIIGKFSALNDWKLSKAVTDEYFCDYIYDITYDQIKATLDSADGILKRDEKSVEALMKSLVIIGIMMSFATSSRPASGSEHHLSHFFEITGIIDNTEYFSHGIDVAFSTVITARLREKLLKADFGKEVFRLSESDYKTLMTDIYKTVASGCIELQNKVGYYSENRAEIHKTKEKEIKEILSETPTADEIEKMLALVELDMADFYNHYGNKKIQNAILYAKDLKDRYTVLWLYYDLHQGTQEIFM